jgi:hypothetical protein
VKPSKVLVEKLTDFDITVLRKFAQVDHIAAANSTNLIVAPVFNNDQDDDDDDRGSRKPRASP